jgi:excisionase family DNA binding protein
VAEDLLTIPEAADYITMTERWIRRAVFEGRIETVKLGRLVRIPRSPRRNDRAGAQAESGDRCVSGSAGGPPSTTIPTSIKISGHCDETVNSPSTTFIG